jgi:hypothetical protein
MTGMWLELDWHRVCEEVYSEKWRKEISTRREPVENGMEILELAQQWSIEACAYKSLTDEGRYLHVKNVNNGGC